MSVNAFPARYRQVMDLMVITRGHQAIETKSTNMDGFLRFHGSSRK